MSNSGTLKRDCHPALAYCWSMMFSEKRYPLFGIMLEVQARAQPHARIRETFRSRGGSWCRTDASAGRMTRALSRLCVEFRGPFPPACRRRVFARRRLNPVVVALVRAD